MKKPHIQWPEQWLRRKRIPSIGFSYSGKDFIISMSLYTLSVVLCLILRGASQDGDTGYVYMIFLLDVFLTALLTEGFFFSLIISIFAVLSVDYIFTPPYWNVSFTLSGFPLTFLVTMTISVVTGIVTSRAKQMDEVRREAELERMHGNLLRAVSHDLRTPLTSIYGACSAMRDNFDALPRQTHMKLLSDVCADAQWLVRMVENLLSVTRIDSEKVSVKKTPTVLEELIDTVLVKFKKTHPGVNIHVELPDDFIVIPMDSMLIRQVLTNLLENAVLHAEGMTTLTLRVFTLGNRAVFEVADNGCGIPKERLRTLFTGTLPSESEADSGKHGMGIGLSVCAAIIKAHGGEIKAESKPGEGTTIRFWLETEEIETEETEDEQ